MLMIRFQRIGRTNDPAFRIAVLEKERAAKAGKIVEQVGTYNPKSKALTLDTEAVKAWIAKGAQPTDSIRNLLINQKVIEGKKINVLPKKTVQVDEEAVKAAAEAEKKAAEEASAAKAAEEAAQAAPAEDVAPVEEAPMPTEAEVVAEAEPAAPTSEEVGESTESVDSEETPVESAPEPEATPEAPAA